MKKGLKKFLLYFISPLIIIISLFSIKPWFGILAFILYIFGILFVNRATIFYLLGSRSYSKGNLDNGITWFEKAHKCAKSKPSITTTYAYALLKAGNIEASEKILQKQLSEKLSTDDNMHVKSNFALVLWKKGQIDEGINMLREVFENFKTTTIYGSLGFFLILKGNLDKALEFNLEAIEYNSSNAVIQDNLGQTYYLMGDYDKSEEVYEKLISTNPTFPEPYFNYGLVMEKKGNTTKALELMNKSLSYNFSFLSTVSKEEIEAEIKRISS